MSDDIRDEQWLADIRTAAQGGEGYYNLDPIVRKEFYYADIINALKNGGGGGGGTSDYTQLTNKPEINGTALTGNKSSSDLGLQDKVLGAWTAGTATTHSTPASTDTVLQALEKIDNNQRNDETNISLIKNYIKFNIITPSLTELWASVSETDGYITDQSSSQKAKSIYFKCLPNQTYKIQKTAGQRFTIGCTELQPRGGRTCEVYTADRTANELTITTSSNANYIIAMIWYYQDDITFEQMLHSVTISQLGVESIDDTVYENDYIITDSSKCIYDTRPYLFTHINTQVTYTVQAVVRKNNDIYAFTSSSNGVEKIDANGSKEFKAVNSFGHVQSAQLLESGEFLVASTSENADVRKVYIYDYDTNAITDEFTPNIDANLVFASKISENEFYLIGWKDTSDNEYFYKYNRQTEVATQIGTYQIPRTYFQGGCKIGNLLFISINDANSNTTPIILILDSTTLQLINTITMYGFREIEGFDVYTDRNRIYAVFADNAENNTVHNLYKMIIS